MSYEDRIKELGLVLPPARAAGNYLLGTVDNGLLFLAGQGPRMASGELCKGKLGRELTVEEGYAHARLTGLMLLSAARTVAGSLDAVQRVVNIFGLVNAMPDFDQHPAVLNGCSDLFVEVFGDNGRHVRAVGGAGSLPGGMSVEVTAMFKVA